MSRTVAILLVTLTSFFCGLPGLCVLGLGALASIAPLMPGYHYRPSTISPQESLITGVSIFFCFGSLLLLIPLIVAIFSWRLTSLSEALARKAQQSPPAS